MNANELADELDYACTISEPRITIAGRMHIAATMLRQQQAEIKELKQQVAFLEDWRDTWSPTIKQLMNINVKAQEK